VICEHATSPRQDPQFCDRRSRHLVGRGAVS
jgi:hypothetical protein